MIRTAHTIGVEPLRNIPGFGRVNHMVTAVVERHGGRLVKVCVTSRPVRGLEGQTLCNPSGRSVGQRMDDAAQMIAWTYGATHVPAVTR